MANIGIIGAGIAGVHLGLYLLKQGISATIYTDRSANDVRTGRLLNTVGLVPAVRDRDTYLEVNRWQAPNLGQDWIHVRAHGGPPLEFRGHFKRPCLFIDMRLYLPTLLEDFQSRGGKVVLGKVDGSDIAELAERHDLVVVASGRAGLADIFPRVPELSPYTEPQRLVIAGLFEGVRLPESFGMIFNLVPGGGEVCEFQMNTAKGPTTGLLIEAVPGGELEAIARLRYEDDPEGFNAAILETLRRYAPLTCSRLDSAAFRLRGPLDLVWAAITPVVRRGYVPLPDGRRYVVGLGDAHVLNDPLTGQGGNTASHAAWLLAGLIVEQVGASGAFDADFCARAEQRMLHQAEPVIRWTNAFLQPPPPHVLQLLVAAAQNQALADTFVENFAEPRRQWELLSSPENTTAAIGAAAAALHA